jgi:ribosomal protein L44E
MRTYHRLLSGSEERRERKRNEAADEYNRLVTKFGGQPKSKEIRRNSKITNALNMYFVGIPELRELAEKRKTDSS